MLRFLSSIFVVILCLILLILMMGGNFSLYIDLPSLLIVVVLPFVYQYVLFGWKDMKKAFQAPFSQKKTLEELLLSLRFFKTHGKITWLFALIAMGLSIIVVLANIGTPEKVGQYLAITLLSIVYAAVINLALVCPYLASIKQHEIK